LQSCFGGWKSDVNTILFVVGHGAVKRTRQAKMHLHDEAKRDSRRLADKINAASYTCMKTFAQQQSSLNKSNVLRDGVYIEK